MTGKTRDPFLALCIRHIWLLTTHRDIDLQVRHIPGVSNTIADTVWLIYSDKPVNNNIFQDLLDNYHLETVLHSYFDLSLHI